MLCVSIPSSTDIEMNVDDRRDYESLKQMLNRVGKAIFMSVDQEISEIIRRRLFEWHGMPEEGRKTASAYAEWAVEHAQELSGITADTAYEQFQAAYPFHPSVLSVFQRKWQSLPRFQRTRGVLRMLALWVAHAYQEQHRKAAREPLITLGLAPFENQHFRAALFEQLGSSELEIPVTTDIVGRADAHAARLDKEAAESIRKAQLHRKIATTIFFESNGGMSQSKAEASLPEIRTGVSGPDLNTADVDNVLEGLAGSCFYLNWERNRYRFGLAPNLNQILVTRRGAVEDKRIEERIKKDTEALFQPGSKELDRRFWPKRSNDVPNRAVLTMVVLGQDTPAEARTTLQMMEAIVRDCGSSGRTYKSALIFAAPDGTTNVRDATRNALAWEDIDDDEETKKRIDESQLKLLARNLDGARRALKEDLFRAYRHIYLLDKNNALRHIDLGQITSSATTPSDGIVGLYLRELRRNDEITEGVSPLQAGQVLATGPDRVVHGRCAGRLLFFPATAPPAQYRHHQAGDLRRRDSGTPGLRDQGRPRERQAPEAPGKPVRHRGRAFRGRVHPEGRGRPEAAGTAPLGPAGDSAGAGDHQGRRAGGVLGLGAGPVQPALRHPRRTVVSQGRHGHVRGSVDSRRNRRRLQRPRPSRRPGGDRRGPDYNETG